MTKTFGKWVVERPLAEGGQGWTYLVTAQSDERGQPFVLKRLKNPKRLERFATVSVQPPRAAGAGLA